MKINAKSKMKTNAKSKKINSKSKNEDKAFKDGKYSLLNTQQGRAFLLLK